jgi:hypothetical protein
MSSSCSTSGREIISVIILTGGCNSAASGIVVARDGGEDFRLVEILESISLCSSADSGSAELWKKEVFCLLDCLGIASGSTAGSTLRCWRSRDAMDVDEVGAKASVRTTAAVEAREGIMSKGMVLSRSKT